MPYTVNLPPGRRGDVFERAIELTFAGPLVAGKPTRIPMPAPAVAQLQATYTLIEAQFKVTATDEDSLIDLSSARGDIRIEAAYPLSDGTTGPAIVLRFSQEHTEVPFEGAVWDLQFSGPGLGPQTWAEGEWTIEQDVSRTAVDTP